MLHKFVNTGVNQDKLQFILNFTLLQTMKTDLEQQTVNMSTLERAGTYLKYFGCKQDTTYVKNLLVGMRLRWKKLLRRTDERGRLLKQSYREDKRVSTLLHFLNIWIPKIVHILVTS